MSESWMSALNATPPSPDKNARSFKPLGSWSCLPPKQGMRTSRRISAVLTRNDDTPVQSLVPLPQDTQLPPIVTVSEAPTSSPNKSEFPDLFEDGDPLWTPGAFKRFGPITTQAIEKSPSRPAQIISAPELASDTPAPQTKKMGFFQKCKNALTSKLGKNTTPTTSSFTDELHNSSTPQYGNSTKKSPIIKSITGSFAAARNVLTRTWNNTVQEYWRHAVATAAAFGTSLALGGAVYELSSVNQDSPNTHNQNSLTGDALVPVKNKHRADINPEFARFLWEQQRDAQKTTEDNIVYPDTLAETPFFQGSAVLNSTYQSDSFTLHTTQNPLDQNTRPIAQSVPLPTIQATSQKTETPPLHTPTAGVSVGDITSPPVLTVGENTPVVNSVDSGAVKTSSSVTENTSKTAMFVISYNKGKTITIPDTNNDGMTVRDFRLGLFAAIPGGNVSRNTPLIYKMADEAGLDTRCIRPGHENDTLTFANIMPGVSITQDCTAENGKTYTITANTQDALDQAVAQLTHPEKIVSSGKTHIKPPLPEAAETVQNTPPRAIPLTARELEELGLPPLDTGASILPSLDSTDTLPPLGPITFDTSDVAPNHDSYAAECIIKDGRYNMGSYRLLPDNQEDARICMESMRREYQTMHDLSPDPAQRNMTFRQFYEKFTTLVTPEQVAYTETITIRKPVRHGGKTTYIDEEVTIKSISKLREVARLAGFSDLTIAKLFGDDIPPRVIDPVDHDGALKTFKMDGWVKTEELILAAAKQKHRRDATEPELTDFVADDVFIAEHPHIIWEKIKQKAEEERTQELAAKAAAEREKSVPSLPPTIAETPTLKDAVSSPATNISSPQAPKQQWAWITIKKGNEAADLGDAVRDIETEFEVRKEFATKGGRPCPWKTVGEFANACYIIKDEGGKVFSYSTAQMKAFTLKKK